MIDRYITQQIRKRDITLHDIIGGKYIDPEPGNTKQHYKHRARWNRFSSSRWDFRFCELLTEGEFDPDLPYNNLAIPVKDIVRYWWNNIAYQEAIIEDIFEDILTCYKDRMLPEVQEEKPMDLKDAFDELQKVV